MNKENFKFKHYRTSENGEISQFGGMTLGWTCVNSEPTDHNHEDQYIIFATSLCHDKDRFIKKIATDLIVERIEEFVHTGSWHDGVMVAGLTDFQEFVTENLEMYFPCINTKSEDLIISVIDAMKFEDYTYYAILKFAEAVMFHSWMSSYHHEDCDNV
jgi:hypothetical protein